MTTEGATPASDSLYPGEYFLQTALDPTSCHNWVVPRVMPCSPLVTNSTDGDVSNQAGCLNGGLCGGMTGTGYSRRVMSQLCLQLGDITVSSGSCFPFGVFLF